MSQRWVDYRRKKGMPCEKWGSHHVRLQVSQTDALARRPGVCRATTHGET
jgi:hypothetical protein